MFYNGVQIYETVAAVSKPSGKPYCDDTREMLEHFDRLGLIRDVPAVLRIQGKIYMHPILFDKFKRMIPDMNGRHNSRVGW